LPSDSDASATIIRSIGVLSPLALDFVQDIITSEGGQRLEDVLGSGPNQDLSPLLKKASLPIESAKTGRQAKRSIFLLQSNARLYAHILAVALFD